MKPVASPGNDVVVHVEEMFLQPLEIVVPYIVAFAASDEERRERVHAQVDAANDFLQGLLQDRNIEAPRETAFPLSMEALHQKGHQHRVGPQLTGKLVPHLFAGGGLLWSDVPQGVEDGPMVWRVGACSDVCHDEFFHSVWMVL